MGDDAVHPKDAPYGEVEAILDAGDPARYDEADALLDQARADGETLFRVYQFRYALQRAQLAARRGLVDEAAAFALGALWQVSLDEQGPQLARHPNIGRIVVDAPTVSDLWGYVRSGDGERYDPVIEDYRAPDTGCIEWDFSLIERLRPNPRIVGPRHAELEAAREAARPLLAELKVAGFRAHDLGDFASRKLPSKKAAVILTKWLPRIDDRWVLTRIASALSDRKARPVAAQPLLDLFRSMPDDPLVKDRVAAAVGTLARDNEFEQIADCIRDPRHGHYRHYLFWAVSYMKDPRAVDLCLELIDDPELGSSALVALGDLRSERARSVLESIAAEPSTRKRTEAAERQRDRVRDASNRLAKLNKAAASGRAQA